MCRNILELRGLEPPATSNEVASAALQYVRKVTGIRTPNAAIQPDYDAAVAAIAALTQDLLDGLPPRRQPPANLPPLRRDSVRSRLGMAPFDPENPDA